MCEADGFHNVAEGFFLKTRKALFICMHFPPNRYFVSVFQSFVQASGAAIVVQ